MSSWIKFEKDLTSDPRVMRMAKELDRMFWWFQPKDASPDGSFDSSNASSLPAVTLVCGALARLWIYADSHAREDNTLDLGCAEIDELIGIPNFCSIIPEDWLVEIDEMTVELPGFQEHNGVEAKKRALTQKRVALHRDKEKRKEVTDRNASSLPDQTKTKTRKRGAIALHPSKTSSGSEIPPGLDLAVWNRWLAYRHEIRKPLREVSIPAAQREMAALGAEQSAAVEYTIAKGWTGLRSPDQIKLPRVSNGLQTLNPS